MIKKRCRRWSTKVGDRVPAKKKRLKIECGRSQGGTPVQGWDHQAEGLRPKMCGEIRPKKKAAERRKQPKNNFHISKHLD
jgi:hypothetical protein